MKDFNKDTDVTFSIQVTRQELIILQDLVSAEKTCLITSDPANEFNVVHNMNERFKKLIRNK